MYFEGIGPPRFSSRRRIVSSVTSSRTARSRRELPLLSLISARRLSGLSMAGTVTQSGIFFQDYLSWTNFPSTFRVFFPAVDEVVAKLAEVASEWRDKLKDPRVPLHAIARESTVGDDAVRKFEEGGQGRNIDRMANAYAKALTKRAKAVGGEEVSVFDLWDKALERARECAAEEHQGKAKLTRGTGAAAKAAKEELKGSPQPKPTRRSKN